MGTTPELPGFESVSTKQARIAQLAKQMPGVALHSLSHHMDIEWMREAYRRTRKDGAPGVDGQTAAEYAANLDENLRKLLDRAKSGEHYRAPPVRRVHIPKGKGSTRPIGIPTFEDKILQRAVLMVLESVYEQDFLDCSYGFRPGRGAPGALQAMWNQTMAMGGGWMLEIDIESYFDSIDRRLLQQILRQRVRASSTQLCRAQRIPDLRNRMRENCTYGSVGASGRKVRGDPETSPGPARSEARSPRPLRSRTVARS